MNGITKPILLVLALASTTITAAEQSMVVMKDGRQLIGVYDSATNTLTSAQGGITIRRQLDPDEIQQVTNTIPEPETVTSDALTPEEEAARARTREIFERRRREEQQESLAELRRDVPAMESELTAIQQTLLVLRGSLTNLSYQVKIAQESKDRAFNAYYAARNNRSQASSYGTANLEATRAALARATGDYTDTKRSILSKEREERNLRTKLVRAKAQLEELRIALEGKTDESPTASTVSTASTGPAVADRSPGPAPASTKNSLVAALDAFGLYSLPEQTYPLHHIVVKQARGKWVTADGSDRFLCAALVDNTGTVDRRVSITITCRDSDDFPLQVFHFQETIAPGRNREMALNTPVTAGVQTGTQRVVFDIGVD